jgi:nucleoside-diphosphate-sugar epimerase
VNGATGSAADRFVRAAGGRPDGATSRGVGLRTPHNATKAAADLAVHVHSARGSAGGTYNVGSGVERSIDEIAAALFDRTGKPASLKKIVPDLPGHDPVPETAWS